MSESIKFLEAKWDITYNHAVGKTVDDKVVMGKRCPKCQRVLVPARSFL